MIMYLRWVLAEAVCLAVTVLGQTDAISGGAGWVGAGLLGAVLVWLFFAHLPAKDKQMRELTDAKDKQITSLIDSKDRQIESLTASFVTTHRTGMENFQKMMDAATVAFTNRTDKMLDTFAVVSRDERTTYQKWHEANLAVLNQLVLEQRDSRHALANLRHELGIKKASGEVVTGQYGPPGPGKDKP